MFGRLDGCARIAVVFHARRCSLQGVLLQTLTAGSIVSEGLQEQTGLLRAVSFLKQEGSDHQLHEFESDRGEDGQSLSVPRHGLVDHMNNSVV